MQDEIKTFEARLRDRFAEVQVPERLAPQNVGAMLQGRRRKNPSVTVVRRVSAIAAAVLVTVLGGMTVLIRTVAVGGAAAESAAYNMMDTAMFDGVVTSDGAPAEESMALGPKSGTAETGANETASQHNAAESEEESTEDEAFKALVEAENQRLETARAKGEER